MKIPETKLPLSFILFTKKFPTMTQRHKFGFRGQGGRGGRLRMVGGHLKPKENIAGPGSELNCKTEQEKFSCYLRTALPFGKEEIV